MSVVKEAHCAEKYGSKRLPYLHVAAERETEPWESQCLSDVRTNWEHTEYETGRNEAEDKHCLGTPA